MTQSNDQNKDLHDNSGENPVPVIPHPAQTDQSGFDAAVTENNISRTFWLTGIIISAVLTLCTLVMTTEIPEIWASIARWGEARNISADVVPSPSKEQKQLQYKVAGLRRAFGQLTPHQPYLIVNSADNEIYLMNGKRLVHQGKCSTGSFTMLKAADQRKWIFQTPRGMFRVQVKVEAPVWRMPDWAFIEDGLPVPPADSPERYEYGVLGEYALAFGNGYLVHGTLYQRFLGMPVTHGCVRLGDDDLKKVYFNLDIGSKIFIY
jgi:L,D-transpeptidase ErfK/SrfK